jgi:hypothetical protein
MSRPRKVGTKKQTTRMVKCQCDKCGYVVRTSRRWLTIGRPRCTVAAHGKLTVIGP